MKIMKHYLIDYAAISPDTMCDALEYAFPTASVSWRDADADCFEVCVIGVLDLDELDDVVAPYIFSEGDLD